MDVVVCDLPYGTTQCRWDTIIPFESLWEAYERIVKSNGAIVLTACQPFTSALVASNPKAFKYELIWEKTMSTGFLDCRFRPLRSHENILVFYREKPTYNPQKTNGKPWKKERKAQQKTQWGNQHGSKQENHSGDREPRSVILIPNPNNGSLHPTQKPVALMEYLILTYTNTGDVVLDNCMGSGTTGVACVRTGRDFIGIEQDAEYFKIAKERIEHADRKGRGIVREPVPGGVQVGLFGEEGAP